MTGRQPGYKPDGAFNPEQQQLPWWRYLIWFFVLVIFSWYFLNTDTESRQILSYSEFKTLVSEDQVAWVRMQGDQVGGEFLQARMTSTEAGARSSLAFVTTLPSLADPELISLLEQHDVEIHAVSGEAHWLSKALIGVLPWILIIGLFWYASNRMRQSLGGIGGSSGLFDFAKSRAKRFRQSDSELSFDDVAGLDEDEAVAVVVFPRQQRSGLNLGHPLREPKELLVRLGQQLVVAALPGQLIGDLDVLELLGDLAEVFRLGLELLILGDDALGRRAVVPEVGLVHFGLEGIAPGNFVVVVKESRGWL